MKAITWLAAVGAAVLTSSAFATTPEGWSTDLDKAFAQAKVEKKSVLLQFTGSDWCPPCIFMANNVFGAKEFVNAASKHFILVELDLPHNNPALKEKNTPWALKYNPEGFFPLTILFNSEGKEFTRFISAEFPKTDLMLKQLQDSLAKKDLD